MDGDVGEIIADVTGVSATNNVGMPKPAFLYYNFILKKVKIMLDFWDSYRYNKRVLFEPPV